MFKKVNKANFRKRRKSSEDEIDTSDEEELGDKLGDIRELQKLREKPSGVDVTLHASGKKSRNEEQTTEEDPFNMKSGGMVDMNALRKGKIKDDEGKIIGTCFAAETNLRDEDSEMLKYVEDELDRRKGKQSDSLKSKKMKNKEDSLYELPENLKTESAIKRSEDMLSNQMLSGIPEVDLGIEAKIKNIEATEEAKQKVIEDRKRKKDEVSDFVPTNYAVNFVQHNRFNVDDVKSDVPKKKPEVPKAEPLRVGDVERLKTPADELKKRKDSDKATDDFHYEKFKKHMRRF